MVDSNSLLYKHASDGKTAKGEHPDHLVVIKYVPTVGDSKVAIDSYVSELFCGGRNTMNIFNECEDSLLATPLILDLTILAELMTRIQVRPPPLSSSFLPSEQSLTCLVLFAVPTVALARVVRRRDQRRALQEALFCPESAKLHAQGSSRQGGHRSRQLARQAEAGSRAVS